MLDFPWPLWSPMWTHEFHLAKNRKNHLPLLFCCDFVLTESDLRAVFNIVSDIHLIAFPDPPSSLRFGSFVQRAIVPILGTNDVN